MEKIRLIELSGKPYQVGYTHGKKCAVEIRQLVDTFTQVVIDSSKWNRQDIFALQARSLPFATDYAPELIEEMRGIAEGSEASLNEIFFLNSFIELSDLSVPELAHRLGGCTSFAVTGKATKNRQTYVCQTFDENIIYKDHGLLLRITIPGKPTSLIYSVTGMLGWMGQNSEGIAMVMNNLFPSDATYGVPYSFIMRKLLQQVRIGDALGSVLQAKRATGLNFIIGDQDEVFEIETTPTRYTVIYPEEGYVTHSNHYVSPSLKTYEQLVPLVPDTLIRNNRAKRLIRDRYGEINLEDLKNIMKDHENYHLSICRHGEEGNEIITLASVIQMPAELKAWVVNGNPCQEAFEEFHVSDQRRERK